MSVWQFTGQGSQFLNMGTEHLGNQIFKKHWDLCHKIALKSNIDLHSLISNADQIHQTQYSQPLIFAYEYALGMSMIDSSTAPKCLIGHSIGEYAAYVIAQMIDLETALQLIILRGKLIGSLPQNHSGMLAVIGSQEKTLAALNQMKDIDLAAINHEKQIVASGPLPHLTKAKDDFKSIGIKSIMLNVSHGFHSHCMDHILDEFYEGVEKILMHSQHPKIQIISTTTGLPLESLTATYLKNHIRQPVQYWPVIQELVKQHDTFIEIGPKPILTKLLQKEPIKAQWKQAEVTVE
jgi:microcystin synthetase protein McyD